MDLEYGERGGSGTSSGWGDTTTTSPRMTRPALWRCCARSGWPRRREGCRDLGDWRCWTCSRRSATVETKHPPSPIRAVPDLAGAISTSGGGLAGAAPAPDHDRGGVQRADRSVAKARDAAAHGAEGDAALELARRDRHGLVNLARQIVMPTLTADERIPLDEAEGRIEGRKLSEIESNSTPENPDEMGEEGST